MKKKVFCDLLFVKHNCCSCCNILCIIYTIIIKHIAQYRVEKARKAVEFARLDDEYDYTTSQKRSKAETSNAQNAMRFQAQFQNNQAIFQQELQERADAHEDNRMAKRTKLRKNMLESSMEQQHGRSMDFITEKTHSEQSSSRLLKIADSSYLSVSRHQQNSSSSMVVRGNSKFPQAARNGPDDDVEEEDCDEDEDEQQLKAYFAGK